MSWKVFLLIGLVLLISSVSIYAIKKIPVDDSNLDIKLRDKTDYRVQVEDGVEYYYTPIENIEVDNNGHN